MPSLLDQAQIIKAVYDETLNRLRVDIGANITLGGDLEVAIDAADGDNIAISDGTNTMSINPDGSIDVNIISGGGGTITVNLDAFAKIPADNVLSVGSEDGTQTGIKHALVVDSSLRLRVYDVAANTALTSIDGKLPNLGTQLIANSLAVNIASDQTVPVSAVSLPLPTGAATEVTLSSINNKLNTLGQKTSAGSVPVVLPSDQIVPISAASLPLPSGAATEAKQDTIITALNSIDAGIPSSLGQQLSAASMPVVLASDQSPISVDITGEPIKISGTIDGTPSGTEYTFVNNIRQQILAAHDRQQDITYADFGTKNQRVTQIDYTSATFPGIIARKTFSYTLVGVNYRRDSIDWSILP